MRGVERFLRQQQARPGYYREFAPSRDLAKLVACNWISVVRQGRFGERTPIIPDGCSDILLCDADTPVIVGPDTRMRWAELPDGQVITGLRLRPGALRAVFGCPAPQLLDQQVPMSDVVSIPDRFLDALNFSDTLQRRHALLEDWVRRSARALRANDARVLAASRMLASEPQLSIGTLARRLDWNARAIHRQFDSACGYGPKHLQRVMRVQIALRVALGARRPPPMSDVALSAGFADQAHMTREFRDLTGFTPTAYFELHNAGVGAWLSETFKTNGN